MRRQRRWIDMGNELQCRARFGTKKSEGKALLETGEIIFRGDFRLKIPFASIQSVEVIKGNLQIKTAGGVAVFQLGTVVAEKWREKILHPKSRMDKLGVKAGASVTLVGFDPKDEEFIRELGERTDKISVGKIVPDTGRIFLKVEARKELKQIEKIVASMRGATALWIVYPKGNTKDPEKVTEANVLAGGRAAGLKDIKVVGFSGTH
ncbi:MAG: hypothetical protein M3N22_00690, partial [Acidobacteriota bacterium]|nr:hypothetical protein [Acidobacteriota bacterium]